MGIGFALYGIAGLYQWLSHDPIIKHTIKCRYCRKSINEKVRLSQRDCRRDLVTNSTA